MERNASTPGSHPRLYHPRRPAYFSCLLVGSYSSQCKRVPKLVERRQETHLSFCTPNTRQFWFSPFSSFSWTLLTPQMMVFACKHKDKKKEQTNKGTDLRMRCHTHRRVFSLIKLEFIVKLDCPFVMDGV